MTNAKAVMKAGKLFVSFWNIQLGNLLEGSFRHRRITSGQARRHIEQARKTKRLVCVSGEDILAPYKKRVRKDHVRMCKVLRAEFDIALSMEEFCSKEKDDAGNLYFVNTLDFAEVRAANRLLVVTCAYVFAKKQRSHEPPAFEIASETVEFHLIEAVRAASIKRAHPRVSGAARR